MTKDKLPMHSDFGTPERARRDGGVMIEVRNRKGDTVLQTGVKAKYEDYLAYLHKVGVLTYGQMMAGKEFERIYQSSEYAAPTRSCMASLDRVDGMGAGAYAQERHIVAKRKLDYLLNLVGAERYFVVRAVAVLGEKVGADQRKKALIDGLERMAHYFCYYG